ncbi:MAG: hypothetical protein A3I78_09930 [Gammaproteobacteria bacterium RIFCSPLOWO2_02_FULL_56_15]|nr:MAG: hypothetical protein A3I78_09930 [Gammaproteobacteria bacterium RIFCSPLOWO2_02_FULL_56_15]
MRLGMAVGLTGVNDFDQGLWRGKTVAQFKDVLNLTPVNWAMIEPEAEPALFPNVAWQVEAPGLPIRAVDVLPEFGLAADGDDSILVVIAEEVGKELLSNAELGVVGVYDAHGFRQPLAQLGDSH